MERGTTAPAVHTHREYPTNVTEMQWQLLIPLLPKRKWRKGGPGHPPAKLRSVFDGIVYLTKTGCQWSGSRRGQTIIFCSILRIGE